MTANGYILCLRLALGSHIILRYLLLAFFQFFTAMWFLPAQAWLVFVALAYALLPGQASGSFLHAWGLALKGLSPMHISSR